MFWSQSPSTYIQQDMVSGMATIYKEQPYTLNFEEQKRCIQMINRSIPVGGAELQQKEAPFPFTSVEIYPFDAPTITLTPLYLSSNRIVFEAPAFSAKPLMEVSDGELYQLLKNSYDVK